MDDSLPFYFWSLNERFSEEDRPSFDNKENSGKSRLHDLKINRREDSSIFTAGRSFLPPRNKASIWQRLHKPIASLPPLDVNEQEPIE